MVSVQNKVKFKSNVNFSFLQQHHTLVGFDFLYFYTKKCFLEKFSQKPLQRFVKKKRRRKNSEEKLSLQVVFLLLTVHFILPAAPGV